MSDPWIDEACRYVAMDEASRMAYWRQLSPDQQQALQRALSAAPPKSRSKTGCGKGCIGVLALVLVIVGLNKVPSALRFFSSGRSRSVEKALGVTTKEPKRWCVVQLTNTTPWPVPYNYGWDDRAVGPLKDVRPDLAPGETRRHCVDFDASETLHLQFRIRVDIVGYGGRSSTQTHEYAPRCALIEDPSLLEVAVVPVYKFEMRDEIFLDFRSAEDGSKPPYVHLGGSLREGPDFRAFKPKPFGVPAPASVPRMKPDYVPPPPRPLIQRCERLQDPYCFGCVEKGTR